MALFFITLVTLRYFDLRYSITSSCVKMSGDSSSAACLYHSGSESQLPSWLSTFQLHFCQYLVAIGLVELCVASHRQHFLIFLIRISTNSWMDIQTTADSSILLLLNFLWSQLDDAYVIRHHGVVPKCYLLHRQRVPAVLILIWVTRGYKQIPPTRMSRTCIAGALM